MHAWVFSFGVVMINLCVLYIIIYEFAIYTAAIRTIPRFGCFRPRLRLVWMC